MTILLRIFFNVYFCFHDDDDDGDDGGDCGVRKRDSNSHRHIATATYIYIGIIAEYITAFFPRKSYMKEPEKNMQTCSYGTTLFIVFPLLSRSHAAHSIFTIFTNVLLASLMRRFDSVGDIFILLCLQRLKTKHSGKFRARFCEFYFEFSEDKKEEKNQNKRKKIVFSEWKVENYGAR